MLGLSALRAERVVSCGADRTCRLWKVPEESQLILRGSHPVIECCAMTRGGEWVSGDAAGTVALWTAARKKPIATAKQAHAAEADATAAGSVGGHAAAGVLSIAACPASDLVVRGGGLVGKGGMPPRVSRRKSRPGGRGTRPAAPQTPT